MQSHQITSVFRLTALIFGGAQSAADSRADTVYLGGHFDTANPVRRWATGVAIRVSDRFERTRR